MAKKCKEVKIIEEFNKTKEAKDNLQELFIDMVLKLEK